MIVLSFEKSYGVSYLLIFDVDSGLVSFVFIFVYVILLNVVLMMLIIDVKGWVVVCFVGFIMSFLLVG